MAATRSFRGATSSSADLTAYTFSAHDIGTAAVDRIVVVGTKGVSALASTLSTVTIGGVSATIAVQQNTDVTGQTFHAGISYAFVPSGATGDIVVTFSAAQVRAAVMVYALAAASAPTQTIASAADPAVLTLDILANGLAIGIGTVNQATTQTWANLTEDSDTTVESSNYGSASAEFATEQTDLAITTDYGTGDGTQAAVAAAFGPANAGAGSADGAATASAVGASTFAATGSSDGAATVSGVGASTAASAGSSDGAATAAAVGTGVIGGAGSADGLATVSGVGTPVINSVGTSAGVATASAVSDNKHVTSTLAIQKPINCVMIGTQLSFKTGRASGRNLRRAFGE